MGLSPGLDVGANGMPHHAHAPHDQGAMQQLMSEERERHEEQLKLETRAREELEDMILRIEKHFKAEQVGGGCCGALSPKFGGG